MSSFIVKRRNMFFKRTWVIRVFKVQEFIWCKYTSSRINFILYKVHRPTCFFLFFSRKLKKKNGANKNSATQLVFNRSLRIKINLILYFVKIYFLINTQQFEFFRSTTNSSNTAEEPLFSFFTQSFNRIFLVSIWKKNFKVKQHIRKKVSMLTGT